MIEAKERDDGARSTLFTVDHFKEMVALEDLILSMTVPTDLAAQVGKESVGFLDLCKRGEKADEYPCNPDDDCTPRKFDQCYVSSRPLDLIYDRATDTFNLDEFKEDLDIIRKVQQGKDSEN